MAQFDLFGGIKPDEVKVMDLTRKIMHEKPVTYKSHRMLMREIARQIGCTFIDKLDSEQMTKFDMLIDLSPDFERSARKVRAEDEHAKGHGGGTGSHLIMIKKEITPMGPTVKIPIEADFDKAIDEVSAQVNRKKKW